MFTWSSVRGNGFIKEFLLLFLSLFYFSFCTLIPHLRVLQSLQQQIFFFCYKHSRSYLATNTSSTPTYPTPSPLTHHLKMPSRTNQSSRHQPSNPRNHNPRAPPTDPSARDFSSSSSEDLTSQELLDQSSEVGREELYEPLGRPGRDRGEEVRLKSPFPIY